MRHPVEHQQKAPVSDPGWVPINSLPPSLLRDVQVRTCARLGEGEDIHLGVNIVRLKEILEHDRCCLAPNRILFLSARWRAMSPMFLNEDHHQTKTKWTEGAGKAFRLLPDAKEVCCPGSCLASTSSPVKSRTLEAMGRQCGACIARRWEGAKFQKLNFCSERVKSKRHWNTNALLMWAETWPAA